MEDLLMCGDLFDQFDHIDDLLDFPDDDDVALMVGDMVDPPPPITQPHVNATPPSLQLHPNGALNNEDDKLFDNLDITDMEWFSNFIHGGGAADSSSLSNPSPDNNDDNGGRRKTNNDNTMFQATSPVSVLETNNHLNSNNGGGGSSTSSSSCSANNNHRCRHKRARTTTFSPRPKFTVPFLLAESTANNTSKKKKKKKKEKENPEPRASLRKCVHCGIEKTPQWRVGPTGPKTLCNACGVRYKSGRLFPEYRPAASPTFVHSLHSNSHKRVVEMRLKAPLPSPESCDLVDYIRTRD